jgi:hypothetical protein
LPRFGAIAHDSSCLVAIGAHGWCKQVRVKRKEIEADAYVRSVRHKPIEPVLVRNAKPVP